MELQAQKCRLGIRNSILKFTEQMFQQITKMCHFFQVKKGIDFSLQIPVLVNRMSSLVK